MRVVLVAALAVAEASAAVVHLVEGCEGREPALVAAGVAAVAAEAPPVVVPPVVMVVRLEWMMRDGSYIPKLYNKELTNLMMTRILR